MTKTFLNKVPMLMTIGNGLMGVLTIYLCSRGVFDYVLYLILVASFLDVTDGWTARKMGVSSQEGANADMASDLISFGLAPAFFAWKTFGSTPALVIAALFLGSILFRLIRFRVGPGLERGFIGVPSPIVALGVVAATTLYGKYGIPDILLLIVILVFSFFAVSSLKFPKWGHPSLHLFPKLISVIIYIVHLILFVFYPDVSVLSMMFIYILVGAFLMIKHKHKEDALESAGVS